jgi:hypothetical protein
MDGRMNVGEDEVAYVDLSGKTGDAKPKTARQIRLCDLVSYQGADVYLDLDADGNLLGIEILG